MFVLLVYSKNIVLVDTLAEKVSDPNAAIQDYQSLYYFLHSFWHKRGNKKAMSVTLL
jgi:hypothetical protein